MLQLEMIALRSLDLAFFTTCSVISSLYSTRQLHAKDPEHIRLSSIECELYLIRKLLVPNRSLSSVCCEKSNTK